MSEFPFGRQTEQSAPETASDEEGGRDRRTLLLAGVLAAAVLGAGAWFFLGNGDDAGADGGVVASASRSGSTGSTTPATTPTPAPTPTTLPPESKVAPGRNPFMSLPVAAAGGGGAPVAGTPVVAPAAPTPETPPTSPPSSPPTSPGTATGTSGGAAAVPVTPTTAPAPTAAPAEPTPALYKLRLKGSEVRGGSVTKVEWVIDSKAFTVFPGQRFGKYGELVVLASRERPGAPGADIVIQVGDAKPLAVRQGQTVEVL